LNAFKDPEPNSKDWKNRQRTLIVSSRGVTATHRQLISDIFDLIANAKRDSKIERKGQKQVIDDLCNERSCNNYLFFESHKNTDLFMWVCKSPAGPSLKFEVKEIHTTLELKL
jgi:ribosome biogenesis protein BRX1